MITLLNKTTSMSKTAFKFSLIFIAILFTILFSIWVIPALIEHPDVIGAFAGGFVNPFSSGYATDAICCWAILLVWVLYEAPKVKYAWVCVLLGIVPGVAVGLALYLMLRMNQLDF